MWAPAKINLMLVLHITIRNMKNNKYNLIMCQITMWVLKIIQAFIVTKLINIKIRNKTHRNMWGNILLSIKENELTW